MKHLSQNKKGLTLIELMVSSSIFIIVMVISIGAVLSIVDANRRAQSLNDVITNLNFSVESMVRDLREGNSYVSSNNGKTVTFRDAHGVPGISYSFNTGLPYCLSATASCITKTATTTEAITSSNVVIDNLNFAVTKSPTTQPTILITISGHAGVELKTQSSFNLETLVTQRSLGDQP